MAANVLCCSRSCFSNSGSGDRVVEIKAVERSDTENEALQYLVSLMFSMVHSLVEMASCKCWKKRCLENALVTKSQFQRESPPGVVGSTYDNCGYVRSKTCYKADYSGE